LTVEFLTQPGGRGTASAVPPPQLDEEVAGAEDPDTLDLREIDEMAVQAVVAGRQPPDPPLPTTKDRGVGQLSPSICVGRTR